MTVTRDPQTHRGQNVNSAGQAEVESVSVSEDRHVNLDHKKVWSLPFEDIDPVAAGDYFFYFSNTNPTEDYILTDVRISSTVAGYVEVDHVSGVPSYTSDTDVVGTNRYLGSSKQPTATMKTDTDTTGLTDDGNIFRIDIDTTGKLEHLRTTAGIIIPQGQSFALKWSAATGALSGVVSIAAVIDD